MIHVLGNSNKDDQAPSDSADPQPLDMNAWSRLQVGSINMQGNLKAKIAELEEYLSQKRYDIVALQEIRKADKLSVKNYRYYAKVNDEGGGGVGILVALHIDPLITRLKSEHKNQLWLKIRGTAGHKDLFFCSAYMPQETDTVVERTTAWDGLHESARMYNARGKVILAGDLNTKLGLPTAAKELRALGPYVLER